MPSAHADPPDPLLDVQDLRMHFPIRQGLLRRVTGHVKAVDGVSFTIREGETLGLVGESGCGKSTTGRCLLGVHDPTGGQIRYRRADGSSVDLAQLDRRALYPYRRDIRLIFQDPESSLNPRMSVLEIVGEPLRAFGIARGEAMKERVATLLEQVGLRPEYMQRYPHAFSGGERQRIGIARALATGPRLVIADEPVSALDVSVQARTLNLMQDLQDEYDLTYLFIAHDLSVVKHICDRVAVMYAGKIVEVAPTEELFRQPKMPYTEALLSAVPNPDPAQRQTGRRIQLEGEVADPSDLPSGCSFHPRCRYAEDECAAAEPALEAVASGRDDNHPDRDRHEAACHFADDLDLRGVPAASA
jgi:peptide/nickel transport system ATP-binding protein